MSLRLEKTHQISRSHIPLPAPVRKQVVTTTCVEGLVGVVGTDHVSRILDKLLKTSCLHMQQAMLRDIPVVREGVQDVRMLLAPGNNPCTLLVGELDNPRRPVSSRNFRGTARQRPLAGKTELSVGGIGAAGIAIRSRRIRLAYVHLSMVIRLELIPDQELPHLDAQARPARRRNAEKITRLRRCETHWRAPRAQGARWLCMPPMPRGITHCESPRPLGCG